MYFAAALVDSLRIRYNTRWTLARIVAGADIHFVVGRDGSTLNFKQVHVSLQPGRAWLVHEKFVAHYFPLSSGMHVEAHHEQAQRRAPDFVTAERLALSVRSLSRHAFVLWCRL